MTTTTQRDSYKRGDVVLVLFPDSNLRTAKRRPALVIQANGLQTGLNQVIISIITSRMDRACNYSRVTILRNSLEGQQSGLLTDSVVMTDNLATVVITALDRVIGQLPMALIDYALRHTLSL